MTQETTDLATAMERIKVLEHLVEVLADRNGRLSQLLTRYVNKQEPTDEQRTGQPAE